jgi:hypothetical protein
LVRALLGCFLVPVDDAPAAGQVAGGPSGASRPVGLFTPGSVRARDLAAERASYGAATATVIKDT